jgi:hypothetical protein
MAALNVKKKWDFGRFFEKLGPESRNASILAPSNS